MKERSITNALLHLRARIVREGQDGLEHVNALLRMRGCDPEAQHVPRKHPADKFRQAELKRLVLDALRSGPQTGKGIAAHIVAQRPHIAPCDAYKRAYVALARMKRDGVVRREGRLWGLPHLHGSNCFS